MSLDEHRSDILATSKEVRRTLRDELRDENLTVAQCIVQFDSLLFFGHEEAHAAVRAMPEREAIHKIRTMLGEKK